MNVPEKKESVPQAVSESEYELEPSMKKSAVPEEHGKGKQAEAAATAVPTTDKDDDVYTVVQQVINDDDEDKPAEAKKQVFPKASRFDSAFTVLHNFDTI